MKLIESSLGVDGDEVSLEETWTKSSPAKANDQSLTEFVGGVSADYVVFLSCHILVN